MSRFPRLLPLPAVLAILLAAGTPAPAQEPPMKSRELPRRARIEGVERMEGPDPTLPALARAIRIAVDPGLSDADLFGITGAAFLAIALAVLLSRVGGADALPALERAASAHPEVARLGQAVAEMKKRLGK